MRILITGARGMLGRHLVDAAERAPGIGEVISVDRDVVDLEDPVATKEYFATHVPDVVVHAAAFVAGVQVRVDAPDDFLMRNVLIDSSVLSAAAQLGVPRLLYVSSAGVYPDAAAQPITEDALMTGPIESTMEPYALAKLLGIRRCDYLSRQHGVAYRAVIPSNIYGPGQHFGGDRAHLVAAALDKAHRAKAEQSSIDVWGDGTALREFTWAPELGSWLIDIAQRTEELPAFMNVGSGVEVSIREVYELARKVVDYNGSLAFDATRPTGSHRRLLDSSTARRFGWDPRVDFASGMSESYQDYLKGRVGD